jgi:hypothetical protein
MIVVRNCFVAKPGQASKLAVMFKEVAAAAQIPMHRVLTDVTGDFNRVIFEFEAENLGEFETRMREYTSNPVFAKTMAGYTDLYITGAREIFRVVD